MWAKKVVRILAGRFGMHRFSRKKPRLWILMYHRILPKSDPRFAMEEPGMIVTPDTFDQHLAQLKQLFTVVPLSEWITRYREGKSLPLRACAITFDDGWADNFEYAWPLLIKYQVPATVFAVSDMVGTQLSFWPNRLSKLLGLQDRKHTLDWLNFIPQYRDQGSLGREETAHIIRLCKQFSDEDILQRLSDGERELGVAARSGGSLMGWTELLAMQESGLVEIGSHTRHHFRLTRDLPLETMRTEIVDSRHLLEQRLGRPVKLFCYPNGNLTEEAARLVSGAYLGAVTTKRGINSVGTDAHRMMRIGVHEDISNTPTLFESRLSGWI